MTSSAHAPHEILLIVGSESGNAEVVAERALKELGFATHTIYDLLVFFVFG
jgi:flavodoxin